MLPAAAVHRFAVRRTAHWHWHSSVGIAFCAVADLRPISAVPPPTPSSTTARHALQPRRRSESKTSRGTRDLPRPQQPLRQSRRRKKEAPRGPRHRLLQGQDLRPRPQGTEGPRRPRSAPHLRGRTDQVLQAPAQDREDEERPVQARAHPDQRRNHPELRHDGEAQAGEERRGHHHEGHGQGGDVPQQLGQERGQAIGGREGDPERQVAHRGAVGERVRSGGDREQGWVRHHGALQPTGDEGSPEAAQVPIEAGDDAGAGNYRRGWGWCRGGGSRCGGHAPAAEEGASPSEAHAVLHGLRQEGVPEPDGAAGEEEAGAEGYPLRDPLRRCLLVLFSNEGVMFGCLLNGLPTFWRGCMEQWAGQSTGC
mmetsp:Transcript_3040/g.6316  ORF Transcript_3040/g.6316 Transcript_3040/m.6316 type:complete len:367 (-) Transcript_3040:110-1210(-)